MAKDGTNIPTAGMVDAHPMNIKDSQYPFMLNGNVQTDITSGVTLTNEHSNFLCNDLPVGYVVIGTMYDPEDKITYLWLVTPDNTKSQLGYLSEYNLTDANDQYVPNDCHECANKKQESTPLEDTTPSPLCQYNCITAAICLNFNINFPIRKGVIKKDDCGDTLYFTDFFNPVRAIKLTSDSHQIDATQRGIAVSGTCDTSPEYYPFCSDNDVDCIAIQLFPTVPQPNVTADSVGLGGLLKAGTYQLAVCYADKNGQRATRTFAASNPVPIFDPAQTLTDQISYPTNMSIKFLIENLENTEYQYIDVFVIGTISGTSTVKEYDTVYIGSLINGTLEYTFSDFEKGKDVSIDSVLQIFPVYEKAQEITTANNVLLLGNLTGPRDLNLQPAVVGLSPSVKWATAEALETFYADGANSANYRSFLRDEVYALGIVFERNNTMDTCVYPLIGRASNSDDLTTVTGEDAFQYPGCESDPNYNLRWKIYNTATNNNTPPPDCFYNNPTGNCATIVDSVQCSSYTFKSTTVVIGPITGPDFAPGTTVTDGTHTAMVLSVIHQHDVLAYITLDTITVTGDFSGTITSGGSSASVISFTLGDTPPNDCYVNSTTPTGDCSANYPVVYNDPSITCSASGCDPNIDPSGTCGPNVRPQFDANGNLCIDSQLLQYPSGLCIPYAYKTGMLQQEVIPLQTSLYNQYDPSDLTVLNNHTPTPPNPTPSLANGPYSGAISPVTQLNNGTWLWPQIFTPTPINNLAAGALTLPPIAGPTGCPEYQSQIQGGSPVIINIAGDNVRYFLGNNVSDAIGCAGGCPSGSTSPDFWGIGPSSTMTGSTNQRNVSSYQSRWYQITAKTPALVVKMKLGFPNNTYVMAAGDLRIDVYQSNPFNNGDVAPVYSTGVDTGSNPALFYPASGGDQDTGVIVIGDVGATPGFYHGGQEEPLIQNNVYYIHCYIVPGSALDAWLNQAPDCNANACLDDISCSGTTAQACCNYPCFLANYAWANFCVDYPNAPQVSVTTPAVSQMNCEYGIVYRQKQTISSGCELQPFEFGDFSYWEAATKTYPSTTYIDASGNTAPLWGDVCGQPIRHFKFPDCLVSYLQDEDPLTIGINGAAGNYVANNGRQAKIYPMGIWLAPEDVKTWVLWAVSQGLITDEERLTITGYKIVRGNRATNKSIIAKGLLYDMFQYKQRDWVSGVFDPMYSYFPNYPFNDLRPTGDPYLYQGNPSSLIKPPNNGTGNTKFAFLSADTTFNQPALGSELKIEAANFGDSLGTFYEVKNHPKYVLLGNGGIGLAIAMAALEESGDLLVLLGQLYGSELVGLTDSVPVGFIMGIVGAILELPAKLIQYLQQWEAIIKNFGVPFNFARYYAAVGNYHSSGVTGEITNAGNKRRAIVTSSYLLGGNLSLQSNGVLVKINNYEREDSVYVDIGNPSNIINYSGTALDPTIKGDFSKFTLSGSSDNNGPGCSFNTRNGTIASMYSSIKSSQPDQYGNIHDIEWIYSGYYQEIDWEVSGQPSPCIPIFGGDTFISRMTQKRKIPFFLDNTVGAATGVDSEYQRISNITDSVYFFNSAGESVLNSSAIQLTTVEQNLDCYNPGFHPKDFYMQGYMYLFSYGIVSFIGEADVNLNYRYAKDTRVLDFYPHQSDIQTWTQEAIVPIYNPNAYFYNRDYSKQNTENFFCTQPAIYHNGICLTTYRNRVITSIPDNDSDFYNDNWRIFLANDYHDFPLVEGPLLGLDGIEKEKVMVRFLNTTMVFNAFYTLDTTAGTIQVGTGSMFDQKPEEYVKSDLGYGGTDNHAFVSTPMGHFWVDAAKHNVFHMPPSYSNYKAPGADLQDISGPFVTFFRNNLPFFILKDFPDFIVDNNYKDIGLSITWDNKFDRVFLTKLDYQLLAKWKGQATYLGDDPNNPGQALFNIAGNLVGFTDTEFFCDKSWTMSYSPTAKSWLSFHSFLPNYYVSHENYFQSGINFARPGATSTGIWNHLISNKSYQVYYGELYPYITDVIVKEQIYNKQLLSLEYQTDYLRFQNDYDYYYNPDVTFNKMVIWTENQNSGNLVLVPQKPNDLSQAVRYPITNPNSTTVMVSRKTHNWRINQFCDLVANKHNNVPPMIYGCSPYLKEVNPLAIWYTKPTFQRQHMTSDYFTTRFINDEYSNYKIINKWFLNNTIKSKS